MTTINGAPRPGDIILLADGFTYVGEHPRDARGRFLPISALALGDGCYEVTDTSGEAFIVTRADERDSELRSAVHDDGQRRAWRVTASIYPFPADDLVVREP